jgi:hypothetical protein
LEDLKERGHLGDIDVDVGIIHIKEIVIEGVD